MGLQCPRLLNTICSLSIKFILSIHEYGYVGCGLRKLRNGECAAIATGRYGEKCQLIRLWLSIWLVAVLIACLYLPSSSIGGFNATITNHWFLFDYTEMRVSIILNHKVRVGQVVGISAIFDAYYLILQHFHTSLQVITSLLRLYYLVGLNIGSKWRSSIFKVCYTSSLCIFPN